jgi:hypothetical protein
MTFRGREVGETLSINHNDNPRCNLAEKYYIIRQSEREYLRATGTRTDLPVPVGNCWCTINESETIADRGAPLPGARALRGQRRDLNCPLARCGVITDHRMNTVTPLAYQQESSSLASIAQILEYVWRPQRSSNEIQMRVGSNSSHATNSSYSNQLFLYIQPIPA